ncbi:hypothetical protein EKO04_008287 [Ascochyta lentis]|uniref:DUF7918 domain-containing protein n=1 Tax=Ascochyta lentis TaxID=205686 RepID=A0A8H7IZQ5_9PLEO|nr:hypothetical protein EKO04_008287 [Ascochyta lentis]
MAIHEDYPGLTVEIVANGAALQEYEDSTISATANTVIRYVEAVAGAEFAIKYSFGPSFPKDRDVAADVFVDGNIIRKPLFHKEKFQSQVARFVGRTKEIVDGKWVEQVLYFGSLDTHDDASNITEAVRRSVQQIGTITVKFEFGTVGKCSEPSAWMRNEPTSLAAVPEAALKGDAKSLQTSFGTKRATTALTVCEWEKEGETPFADFEFRYRSRSNLEALHIVPRTPTPTSAATQETVKTSSRVSAPDVKPVPEVQVFSPLRQSSAPTDTPVLRQQSPVPGKLEDTKGLTEEELVALITHYRGNSQGLAGQSRKRLLVLLMHHEDQEKERLPIESGPPTPRSQGVHVKRERDEDHLTRDGKRSRPEVIVLDD